MGADDVGAEIAQLGHDVAAAHGQIAWLERLLWDSEVLDDDAAHGRAAAGTAA